MASFKNFVLPVLLTITLVLLTEAAIPSEEEKKELERQLKAINKPAIKSFKTEHGVIFDCIDIHKQLAFDHPLLKNHSVQRKPATVPEGITSNNISSKVNSLLLLPDGINCPDETRETTLMELDNIMLQRLTMDLKVFTGVKGHLNLWEPQVSQDQISLAFIAVAGGPKERFASIFVGWMVNPSLYHFSQDHVRLYTYWNIEGSNPGCYDITCPGFVQVSKNIPLGSFLQPLSVYNGLQYDIDLTLYQDRVKGDWWFAYNHENVGYWPASLFKAARFENRANYAAWGGQVYSPVMEKTPEMGSGHWPREGLGKSAYVNDIRIIDGMGNFLYPEPYSLKEHETSSKCYRAMYVHEDRDPWVRALYYGGPSGCIG
uniref:Neprosin PEP catalytic domain-containing protein n=1 Tax=Brassica oleracea var. oleracea TaxID=109376 RepID=A0A0D3A7M9_BRAOL